MEISEILNIIKVCVSAILTLTPTIIMIVKAIKNKKWNDLAKMLEEEIVPLMEQAEAFFTKPEDKEEWVLNKLSLRTHIDFYKWGNILALAKEIIKKICKLTKTNVNKVIVFEKKEEIQEQKETYTNGVA